MKLSEKQLDYILYSKFDFNFSTGAIRSGKTFGHLIRCIEFITGDDGIPGEKVLCIGKTLESVRRNFADDLMKMIEHNDILSNWAKTTQPLEITYKPKNITCVFVGANDESAESKIRGMTAQAVFGDEVTLWPKNIFMQSIGRASAGSRYKFYTCNPDRPTHYIKREFIDNPNLNSKTWNFTLDDNPALTAEYKKTIKNSFTGVMFDRMVMGRWVAVQEGAVFYNFDKEHPDKIVFDKNLPTVICWDFGVSDPTHIIAFQVEKTPEKTIIKIINEYQNNNKDAAHYAKVVKEWHYEDAYHYGDPSGGGRDSSLSSWFNRLRSDGIMIQYPPYLSVAEYIANANKYMAGLQINGAQSPKTLEAIQNWTYPLDADGKVKEGEKPLHNEFSHAGTALYYGIAGYFPPQNGGGLKLIKG